MIGFIGLGIMGSRMARNLQKNGFNLIVHNRTKEKATELIENGAMWADSPEEVGRKSDIVITMLTTPNVVEEVAFGKNGFFTSFREGKLWIDSSTVNPAFSEKMAVKSQEHGARFLDAPVAGSFDKAENAELIFLVGGESNDVVEAMPLLEAMGEKIIHQGEHGTGSKMKLVINLMLAQTMAAFTEAVHFGEAIGIEKDKVVNTLLGGATAAPFLKGKKQKVLNAEFSAEFPLEHVLKDMNLIAQTAYEQNIALPIANVTKEMYSMAKQKGLGRSDFSAIYDVLKEKK